MRLDLPREACRGRRPKISADLSDSVRPRDRSHAPPKIDPAERCTSRPDPVPRPARPHIPRNLAHLSLRTEERKILAEVGRFRIVSCPDLAQGLNGLDLQRLESDLAFLRKKGWIDIRAVGRGRDQERPLEVVTLTRAGYEVARHMPELARGQRLYAGLAKPSELEHDVRIYPAYCQEAERIARRGGTCLRVLLDAELRSEVQKQINAARRLDPERSLAEIRLGVARHFDLPYTNGGIQIPDARIVYELDQGSRTGHEDIEVLSASYKACQLRNKSLAGFRVYASPSDRARLSARVEQDRQLMENILEL